MILIVSQGKHDATTEDVLDWIDYLGGNFIRLNGDDIYDKGGIDIELGKNGLKYFATKSRLQPHTQKFNIGWYRRWSVQDYLEPLFETNNYVRNSNEAIKSLGSDDMAIKYFLLRNLDVKFWLTNPFTEVSVNKLHVLIRAIHFGLEVPETRICTSKDALKQFSSKFDSLICKDITNPHSISLQNLSALVSKTVLVTKQDIENFPDTFLPTLFQNQIEKDYEIRAFFLEDQFYPMAIMSQNDQKTSVDFRNYNMANPNRNIPCRLPKDLELKLSLLFKDLRLMTGSADIIKTKDNKYIFLEINPIGQIGMTSFPCNYKLERKIAEYLIKNDN